MAMLGVLLFFYLQEAIKKTVMLILVFRVCCLLLSLFLLCILFSLSLCLFCSGFRVYLCRLGSVITSGFSVLPSLPWVLFVWVFPPCFQCSPLVHFFPQFFFLPSAPRFCHPCSSFSAPPMHGLSLDFIAREECHFFKP